MPDREPWFLSMIESLLLPLGGLALLALAVYAAARLLELVCPGLVPPNSDPWLRRPVAGLWIWGLLLFALAFRGAYTPERLRLLVSVAAVLGGVLLLRDLRAVGPGKTPLRPPWPWLVALGAFFAAVWAVAVNPVVSWDGAVYHLALPDLYLEAGGFRPAPFLVYAHWPQAVELLYGAAMALLDHRLAKVVHLAFGLLCVALLARAARGPRWAGGLAGGLFLLSGVVVFEIRVAYVDLALAFFCLALFLLLDQATAEKEVERAPRLVLAGAAAGLVAASKISGIVLVVAIAVVFLPAWLRISGRRGLRATVRPTLFFFLPAALLWLPWVLRTFLATGNPFYPALFGGPDWSPELAQAFAEWQRSIGMGREPVDWLLLPWRVIVEGGAGYERFDGRLSVAWLVALPFALWQALRRAGSRRAGRALAGAGLYFVFWAATSQQMRFLVPVLPLLALVSAEGMAEAARRLRRRSGSPWLRPRRIGACLAVAWSAWMAWDHGPVLRAGVDHLRLYARPGFHMPETPPRPPIFDSMESLPQDAVILLLGSNHLLHCPRECLVDSFFEASQIADWLSPARNADEVADLLRRRGATHVAWAGPTDYPAPLLELLRRPDHVRLVARPTAETALWELRQEGSGQGS